MADPKTISILDVEFTVSMPYNAGHTLTEAEAKVLNQTRRENLGNNFRAEVKKFVDGAEGALTQDELVAEFAKRDTEYVFTLANAGASRKFTPEEREARTIARQYVRQELDKQGLKIGTPPEGTSQEDWDAVIESNVDAISQSPEVVAMAKSIVKTRSKTATLTLTGIGQPAAAPAAE